MATYEIQGVGVYDYPDDMSEQDVYDDINNNLVPSLDLDNPDPEQVRNAPHLFPNIDRGSFFGGLGSGAERLGRAPEAVGAAVGRSQEELDDLKRQMAEDQEANRYRATLDDVGAQWDKGDYLDAAGTLFGDVLPQTLGESIPDMGIIGTGAVTGAIAMAPVPIPGARIIGAVAGAAVAGLPTFFGMNVERQIQENNITDPDEIETMRAAGAALIQGSLEGLIYPALGLIPGASLLTGATAKALVRRGAQTLSRPEAGKLVLQHAIKGGATEAVTEVGQQMLERAQAGLEVTDPEALKEYIHAAILGGLLGVGFGVAGGAYNGYTLNKAVKTEYGLMLGDAYGTDAMINDETAAIKAEEDAAVAAARETTLNNMGYATDEDGTLQEVERDEQGNIVPKKLALPPPDRMTPIDHPIVAEQVASQAAARERQRAVDRGAAADIAAARKRKEDTAAAVETATRTRAKAQADLKPKTGWDIIDVEENPFEEQSYTVAEVEAVAPEAGRILRRDKKLTSETVLGESEILEKATGSRGKAAEVKEALHQLHMDRALEAGAVTQDDAKLQPHDIETLAKSKNIKTDEVSFNAFVNLISDAKDLKSATPYQRYLVMKTLDNFARAAKPYNPLPTKGTSYTEGHYEAVVNHLNDEINNKNLKITASPGLIAEVTGLDRKTDKKVIKDLQADLVKDGFLWKDGNQHRPGRIHKSQPNKFYYNKQGELVPRKKKDTKPKFKDKLAKDFLMDVPEAAPEAAPMVPLSRARRRDYVVVPTGDTFTVIGRAPFTDENVTAEDYVPDEIISRGHETKAEAEAAAKAYRSAPAMTLRDSGEALPTTSVDLRDLAPDPAAYRVKAEAETAAGPQPTFEVSEAIKKAVNDPHERRGLAKLGIALKIVEDLGKSESGHDIEAEYHNRMIHLAASFAEANALAVHDGKPIPVSEYERLVGLFLKDVMNHEHIHALKAAGVISDTDWNMLARMAETKPRPGKYHLSEKQGPEWTYLDDVKAMQPEIAQQVKKKGETDAEYEQRIEDDYAEEAVAELFRDWMRDPSSVTGKPASIFRRIIKFITSLGGWLHDTAGVRSVSDIFREINTGEMAQGAIDQSNTNLLDFIKSNPDGFTVTVDGQTVPTSGFAFAPVKGAEIIVASEDLGLSHVEQLASYIRRIQSITGNEVHAGGWLNPADNMYYLDASLVFDNKEQTLYAADAAQQEAIFDLGEFNDINTVEGIAALKEAGTYSAEAHADARRDSAELAREFQETGDQGRSEQVAPAGEGPHGDLIDAPAVRRSVSTKLTFGDQDGDAYFAGDLVEGQLSDAGKSDSRTTLIYLTPDEFLKMAERGYRGESDQLTYDLLKQGKKFNQLPFLYFKHDGEGTAKIVEHEGRHRARNLKLLAGVQQMPVILHSHEGGDGRAIRWGKQRDQSAYDYVANKPTILVGQGQNAGNQMPMPTSVVWPDPHDPNFEFSDATPVRRSVIDLNSVRERKQLKEMHKDVMDRVEAHGAAMQEKADAHEWSVELGDRVQTEWGAKRNIAPWKVIGFSVNEKGLSERSDLKNNVRIYEADVPYVHVQRGEEGDNDFERTGLPEWALITTFDGPKRSVTAKWKRSQYPGEVVTDIGDMSFRIMSQDREYLLFGWPKGTAEPRDAWIDTFFSQAAAKEDAQLRAATQQFNERGALEDIAPKRSVASDRATEFARIAHEGQTRRYTGEPYVEHPMEVADTIREHGGSEAMIQAALLHDVVEDTSVTIEDIHENFGPEVSGLVAELTDISDPEDGNRAFRKAKDRDHLAGASRDAQIVKLADLIANTRSIKEHDPDFYKVYRKEKLALLDAMDKAHDHPLYAAAMQSISETPKYSVAPPKLVEGPVINGRLVPRLDTGATPEFLYRHMSREEYQAGKAKGAFQSQYVHASLYPDTRYAEPGSVLTKIAYDDADGWGAKYGDGGNEVYAGTFDAIPADKVTLVEEEIAKYSVAPPVNSAAFKRMFKNTKVVDENGKPLKVYRGLRSAEGGRRGDRSTDSWAETSDVANVYTTVQKGMEEFDFATGANVLEGYLNIERPIDWVPGDYDGGPSARITLSQAAGDLKIWPVDKLFNFDKPRADAIQAILEELNMREGIGLLKTSFDGMVGGTNINSAEDAIEAYEDAITAIERAEQAVEANDNEETQAELEAQIEEIAWVLDGVEIDAYALADLTLVTDLAEHAGYDGIKHMDVINSGIERSEAMLGKGPGAIEGVTEGDGDYLNVTWRPFKDEQAKSTFNPDFDPTDKKFSVAPPAEVKHSVTASRQLFSQAGYVGEVGVEYPAIARAVQDYAEGDNAALKRAVEDPSYPEYRTAIRKALTKYLGPRFPVITSRDNQVEVTPSNVAFIGEGFAVDLVLQRGDRFQTVRLPEGQPDGKVFDEPTRRRYGVRVRRVAKKSIYRYFFASSQVEARTLAAKSPAINRDGFEVDEPFLDDPNWEGDKQAPKRSVRMTMRRLDEEPGAAAMAPVPLIKAKKGVAEYIRGTVAWLRPKEPYPIILLKGHAFPDGVGFGLEHIKQSAGRFGGQREMAGVLNRFLAKTHLMDSPDHVVTKYNNPDLMQPSDKDFRVTWTEPDTQKQYVLGLEIYMIQGTDHAVITTFFPILKDSRKAEVVRGREASLADIEEYRAKRKVEASKPSRIADINKLRGRRRRSVAPALNITATGPNGRTTMWDIGTAMDAAHLRDFGRALDPADPQDRLNILQQMLDDFDTQMGTPDTGLEWYTEDIKKAFRISKRIIPELRQQGKRNVFLAIAALTSPQTKANVNWEHTIQIMQEYLRTGTLPTRKADGKMYGVPGITTGLRMLQMLIDQFGGGVRGEVKAIKWLKSPHTAMEIARFREQSGLFTATKTVAGKTVPRTTWDYHPKEMRQSDNPLGFYTMGPKVGDFFMNATGFDNSAVTVDIWMARTYNRIIGRLTDVTPKDRKKKKIRSDLRSRDERDQIKALVRDVAGMRGIDPSAAQAILWFFEQRLFNEYGVSTSENRTFSQGAAEAAQSRNVPHTLSGRIFPQAGRDRRAAGTGRSGAKRSVTGTAAGDAHYAELTGQNRKPWHRARMWLKKQLAPGGLLHEIAFGLKIERDGEFHAGDDIIKRALGELDRAVRATYGRFKSHVGLTDQQRLDIDAYLHGDQSVKLSPAIKAAVELMRQQIDGLTDQYTVIIQEEIAQLRTEAEALLKSGNPADAERAHHKAAQAEILATTIQGNKGEYVNRSYKVFDDPYWHTKIPPEVYNNALAYLTHQHGGDQQAARVLISKLIKGDNSAFNNMEALIREGSLGAKDLTLLMARKDIAPEIRALMGENKNAALNFTRTYMKMNRLIWNTHFQRSMLKEGLGVFMWEPGTEPPEASVSMVGTGSKVLEAFAGLQTTPETRQALIDAVGKSSLPQWMNNVIGINGAIKYGKVVVSPATQIRNFFSAPFFVLQSGTFNLRHTKKAFDTIREQIAARNGSTTEYYRHLVRKGVLYDTPNAGMIQDLLDDGDRVWAAMNHYSGFVPETAKDRLKGFNEILKKLYRGADDFWKIVAFEGAVIQYMEAKPNLSRAEVEDIVAKRVRDTIPTYSLTGSGMKKLSRFPIVGSFVAFSSEIVRTSINNIKVIKSDLADPDLKPLAYKRMVGMALAHSWAAAASALSASMVGIGDDEEEAIRKLGSPWAANASLAFLGRDDDGNLRTIDLSFLDPYGYFKKPLVALMRDMPWEDSFAEAFSEVYKPFFGWDIAASAIYEISANRKLRSGAPIFNPDAPTSDQAADIGEHLFFATGPGVLLPIKRIYKAMQGDKSVTGREYNMRDEIAGAVGLRMSTYDPKFSLYFRTSDFREMLGNSNRYLSKIASDLSPVDTAELADAFAQANKIRDRAYDDMQYYVAAAKASGVSDRDIRRVLRVSGISKRYANALARGKEAPKWKIGRTFMKGSVKRAKLLIDRETAKDLKDRQRFIRQQAREAAE